jgi:hypothetical protein
MLSVTYAECHIKAFMLSLFILNVIMLSVVMLSVVSPFRLLLRLCSQPRVELLLDFYF